VAAVTEFVGRGDLKHFVKAKQQKHTCANPCKQYPQLNACKKLPGHVYDPILLNRA